MTALTCQKVEWKYGQGTTLRLVRYLPNGSVFLQSVGEDDNGVIELPAELVAQVGAALCAAARDGSTAP